MAQHAFARLAHLLQQGRRAALSHVALRRQGARHVDAVPIDDGRAQVGGHVQLAHQHGQVVGRVQGREYPGAASGVALARQRQVQGQLRRLARRAEQAGQARLALFARALHAGRPFLRQRRRHLGGGQGGIEQLAAHRIGDDEGADGDTRLQQPAGQRAQGGDVAVAQGGRGGNDARGQLCAVQVALDGCGHGARRLRRLADDVVALARVALRHQQDEDECRRNDPGEHQP